MKINYIIVQAGGRGSRMGALTENKPKALVPVQNLPVIFHLFRKFPDKKFIIIGDYKYDVLKKYLAAFADVDHEMICAAGKKGTCAGLSKALGRIPEKEPLMLVWCDLVLSQEYEFPKENGNYVGISKDFPCRWSYTGTGFIEEESCENGVAGHFIFKDKSCLAGVPDEGEFVAWLGKQDIAFSCQPLYRTHEYGTYSEWEKLPRMRCRPFNRVETDGARFIKRPADRQGYVLAQREVQWYQKIQGYEGCGGVRIPDIYSFEPLTMQRISGRNVYEYDSIPAGQKRVILEKIIEGLKNLHHLERADYDRESYWEAYIGKTKSRLEKVRGLVPFAAEERIIVNGVSCRNIFFCWKQVETMVMSYAPAEFVLLHGDCTFSNIMLDENGEPYLIDPRGYFGNTQFYGDPAYDWVKLYYSLLSNYDRFNLKQFALAVNDNSVTIEIRSNHWEDMEDDFFELLRSEISRKQMKVLLAIIWLSLTTYAWEDYDSICGAFYNGLLYLEEALRMEEQEDTDVYFAKTAEIIDHSLKSLDRKRWIDLAGDCEAVLRSGHKIVASGLGKNVPVCEKFVGTMLSLGMNANFLHTNSAVHGDMGMVQKGDLMIILSKSGDTEESVSLTRLLQQREGVRIWTLCFNEEGRMVKMLGKQNSLIVQMEHEGDPWNIVPNNSTTLNLIILQGLAMFLAKRMGLSLEKDFKPNHPGGAIGAKLNEG